MAGAAAELALVRKHTKYAEFARDYTVVPIALESLGPLAEGSDAFLKGLAKRIRQTTGEQRAGVYFYQRLSLAVQRGNAL